MAGECGALVDHPRGDLGDRDAPLPADAGLGRTLAARNGEIGADRGIGPPQRLAGCRLGRTARLRPSACVGQCCGEQVLGMDDAIAGAEAILRRGRRVPPSTSAVLDQLRSADAAVRQCPENLAADDCIEACRPEIRRAGVGDGEGDIEAGACGLGPSRSVIMAGAKSMPVTRVSRWQRGGGVSEPVPQPTSSTCGWRRLADDPHEQRESRRREQRGQTRP